MIVNFCDLEISYYVGENKNGQKVVTCKINAEACSNTGLKKDQYLAELVTNILWDDNRYGKYVFTGRAVLAKGDKYDEELGKKIAESKAKLSMFRKLGQLNIAITKVLEIWSKQLDSEFLKLDKIVHTEIEHYTKLTNKDY